MGSALLLLMLLGRHPPLTAYDHGSYVEVQGSAEDVARFGMLVEIKDGIIDTSNEELQAGFAYAVWDYKQHHTIRVFNTP